MTVHINTRLCNGCGSRAEGCCEEMCPGDLFYRKNGKACLREPSDCWDCFACVKVCPRAALSIELPFQISEAKHRLAARLKKNGIEWNLVDRRGTVIATYIIQNKREAPSSEPNKQPKKEKQP